MILKVFSLALEGFFQKKNTQLCNMKPGRNMHLHRLENVFYDVTCTCILKKFKKKCLDQDLKGVLRCQSHYAVIAVTFDLSHSLLTVRYQELLDITVYFS